MLSKFVGNLQKWPNIYPNEFDCDQFETLSFKPLDCFANQ